MSSFHRKLTWYFIGVYIIILLFCQLTIWCVNHDKSSCQNKAQRHDTDWCQHSHLERNSKKGKFRKMVNLLIPTFTWLLIKKIQFICRTQRSSKNNQVTIELRSTSVIRTCCCSIFYFILGLNFRKYCHTLPYRKTKERKFKPRIKLNHNKHM